MGNLYSVNALGILTPNVLRTSHLPFSCSFKCSNCLPKASRLEKRQTSTDEDADAHGEPPIPADADTHKNIQKLPISHSSNTTQRDEGEKSSGYNLRPQVFLSHSGKQKNFARHLVKEMKRENISCFFDEDPQSLPKGEAFPPRILEAAKNCEVAVVVLSEDFISSKWPMKELCAFVKAKNSSNPSLKILPLFFGMSPDSLAQRLQKKISYSVGESYPNPQRDQIDFNEWIEALEALRAINGVNYTETEGEVAYIEKIVHHIRRLLPPKLKYEESDVEGKERLCQELAKLFDRIPCRKNEVKVGGLYGVAGIGKTTISRILCNFYFTDFHGRVFHVELGRHPTIETLKHALRSLCDASESRVNSVTCLEDGGRLLKDMMYGKKVFLAVDNISDLPESIREAQMYLSAVCSAGKQSMILLTSRSSTILERFIPEESDLLHVPSLEEEEAIAVLLQGTPLELSELTVEQKDIARKCVQKCCFGWQSYGISAHHRQYHPLVLRILGAFIYDKFQFHSWADLSRWIDERSASWRGSKQEVFQIFDESFRRLSVQRRRIFVLLSLYLPESHMTLEAICNWLVFVCDQEVEDVESAIIELKRKGFMGSTQESRFGLYIHELLIEFAESLADGTGECISLKGNVEIPATLQVALSSDRPRFWAMKFDNCHLQSTGMVNNELFTNILVLHLKDMRGIKTVDLSAMKILRSITIVGCSGLEEIRGLESLRGLGYFILKDCTVNAWFYSEIQCLKSLRHLDVAGSPWETVTWSLQGPWASFPPLQGLSNLGTIYVDDLTHGTGSLDLTGLSKLQTVWLSRCNIIRLDFSGCLELRTINIRGCYNLSEIHLFNPLCFTMNLFSRAGYANLTALELMEMPNLMEFPSLSGLTHLTSLWLWKMDNLKELPSLGGLTHLTHLGLWKMDNLKELPSLSGLTHLTELMLLEMGNLEGLPSLSGLTHLTSLRLWKMGNLKELPSLSGLTHLTSLTLVEMDNLKELPSLSGLTHLTSLRLSDMGNLKELPSLSGLTHLTALFLGDMGNLEELPNLSGLTHLTDLELGRMDNLKEFPSLSGLTHLTSLWLWNMDNLKELPSLSGLTHLTHLGVLKMDNLKELPSLSGLTHLTELTLLEMDKLKELPSLSGLTHLTELRLSKMDNLKELPSLSGLTHLSSLELGKMNNLKELPSLSGLTHLTDLRLSEMGNLKELPSLSGLTHLTSLWLWKMDNLKELPTLSGLTHLTHLGLWKMDNLKELPSLSGLTHLTHLGLWKMGNLKELPSLSGLTHLTSLTLVEMGNLKEFPSLSGLTHLTDLELGKMDNLQELPSLSGLTHLTKLRLSEMGNLEQLPSLSGLTHLTDLRLSEMSNLKELPSLSGN